MQVCRQRAGCNAGTLTARNLVPPVEGFRGFRRFKRLKAGKRQLTARNLVPLLECPNKRGLCAGKGQAAMLER